MNMKDKAIAYAAAILMILTLVAAGCAPRQPAEQSAEVSGPQGTVGGTPAGTTPGQAPDGTISAPTQSGFNKIVYFDYDSYNLKPEAKQELTELVSYMKANSTFKVQIAGNCDERGTNEYNVALGDKRARVVQEYCVSSGIDPKRISTISYGEEKPLHPGHNEEAWSKNRRDEFVFSK